MNKNTNIHLRALMLEATAIENSGKRLFTNGERLMLLELAMAYNPNREGCHKTGKNISELVHLDDRVFRLALPKAEKYLGLRWIQLKRKDGKQSRSKYAGNSYDFRHFDSCFNSAWRGDNKVFVFDNRGNIDEPFNGKTLSFNPFRELSESFDSPLKNRGDSGASCVEYRIWFTRAINGVDTELAAAISDHKRVLKLSEEETWKNVQRVIKSDLDDVARVALVRHCIRKNYRRIDPSKWQVTESDDEEKVLRDALRDVEWR